MTNEEFTNLATPCYEEGPEQDRAIAFFCAKLRPYLWVVLSRLNPGDHAIAEDAIQSTFVKIIEMFRGQRHSAKLSPAYCITIAKHCLVDEVRRRKKYSSLDEIFPKHESVDIGGSTEDLVNRENLLLLAMERLGPKCRFILERYYFAQVKGPQLALELGISPDSISMSVKRCRDELRHILTALVGPT
jgi:RNA polymerase sigma factor (sigma-70 family)